MLKKITLFTLLFCVVTLTKAQQQTNEKRLALVIGNAAYLSGSSLKNPVNDANLIASTLQQLGFEVKKLTNADLKQMQKAAIDFTNQISSYDVALFYYAGHGVSVEGTNYLIPVDAKLDDKLSAKYEAFDISDINYAFAQNSGKMNIMILDACRDNPFRSWMRGGERGFKAIGNQATGTIIAFATREGETASDGSGNNGLFTEKLAEQMKVPQSINDVFMSTRIKVLQASANKQCPQEWNMLTGNFYFAKNTSPAKQAEEPAATGSLQLITELSGKFYIDGVFYKDVSAGSTYTFSNIPSGVRVLSISGTVNWTEKVAVISGQTTTVSAKKEVGSIELYSEISGSLYIDKVLKKSITANSTNTFSDISAGVHPLKIEGAQPWAENVYVSAGQTVKVTANKVEKTGSVNIASQIDGKLYIDDVYRQTINTGSSSTISDLSEGQHTAKIKDASTGQELWSENFEISKGQTTYLTAKAAVSIQTSVNYTETASGVNIDMVFIHGGTFTMGSPTSEADRSSDETQHSVILSDYYIGKYEVTQKQWRGVMGIDPPELYNKGCDECPVERVSWNDIQEFITKLNQQTGKKYGLPTEAQWEYSCRAGTSTPFSTGNNLTTEQANYDGNYPYNGNAKGTYREKTMPVGSFKPNAWGLYDMHGNVWEWCSDWYGSYSSGSQTNPTGPSSGSNRVDRGGSWNDGARYCRSANRRINSPDGRGDGLGFRLVCVP